ncbi:AAA family ATPase [Bacteroidota bacterium]
MKTWNKYTKRKSFLPLINGNIDFLNFQYIFNSELTNWATFENIDIDKFSKHLQENYETEIIVESYFNKDRGSKLKGRNFLIDDTVLRIVSLDTCAQFDRNQNVIRFTFSNKQKEDVLNLFELMTEFSMPEIHRKKIAIIKLGSHGFFTDDFKLPKNKINIELNYNDSLLEMNQLISENLGTKDSSGLVLLHGNPGTGKTSYIRYLLNSIDKEVIFLPTSYANKISDPEFVTFLLKHKNSILIIEDAEQLLIKRESSKFSAVSALLNVTDGLLGDVLNIQVVCTFNTHLSNIDEALVRKGRLLARYEFEALSVQKANNLAENLKLEVNFTSPQNLSEIYNYQKESFNIAKPKVAIGFN